MTLRFLYAIPIALYSLLIFYLSSLTSTKIPDFGFYWQDKVIHAGAFFVYGVFLQIFLEKSIRIQSKKRFIIIFLIIGCIFGASDELHQYFVPGRTCELLDWLADATGILLSLGAVSFVRKRSSIR